MAVRGDGMGERSSIERAGSLAIQAGLLSTAFVGITLAMFGPLFSAAAAYLLLAAAGVVAVLGFRWADRVGHATRPIPGVARRDARVGRTLSALSLAFVFWSTGLWFFFLLLWPAVLVLGLIAWVAHRAGVASSGMSQEAGT